MDADTHTKFSAVAAPVCALRGVTLRYENGVQALEDVSFSLDRGEHVCVLGANGSGKSTLASVLCGLLAPDEGVVELLGTRVFDSSREVPVDLAAYGHARRHIGLVFQNPDDQIVTTIVEEDVAFGPENLGVASAEIGERVSRELHRVALDAYAKADPTRLSGGQKQRVAIAGALAMEPDVLVLDEPGALLDVRGRRAIMRVMGRLKEAGSTIVHITHFMEEALQADRVVVLDHGHVALEGTPDEVFSHVDELDGLALEAPFSMRLARELRAHGVDVPLTCDAWELVPQIATHAFRPVTNASASAHDATCLPVANPAVKLNSVSFAYDTGKRALKSVSMQVAHEAKVALIGQTGSGKSTLSRLVCALEVPDSGTVTVEGIDTSSKKNRRQLHGRIGYVMQHPERQLFAETVAADVAYGPRNMGLTADEVERRVSEALATVHLTGLEHVSPFELSGGQQRLCAIAGVLAMSPSTLVLDEPMAGLDPARRNELRDILERIHAQGTTIIQITHSMDEAARADTVFVLDEGRIRMSGAPAEVFRVDVREELTGAGLGIPHALEWALLLEEAGTPNLGNPLTFEALVDAILSHLDSSRDEVV